jgi:hypothetical protein
VHTSPFPHTRHMPRPPHSSHNIYYVFRILTVLTLKRFSYFCLDFKFFVVLCSSL